MQAAPLSFTAPDLDRELPAALALAAIFLVLFAVAEVLRRAGGLRTESTRKLVHVGAGVAVLAVPAFFTSLFTVLTLTASFLGIMFFTKKRGVLPSIHQVGRPSSGAVVYPVSLGILLVLSGGRPVLFDAPLLVLALADATAALVGTRFGRHKYFVNGDARSVEGSAAFCAVSFAVIAGSLSIHGAGPGHALAVALAVAPALTAVEAIATRGYDNLLLPLAGFIALAWATTASDEQVWMVAAVAWSFVFGVAASLAVRRVPARQAARLSWFPALLVFVATQAATAAIASGAGAAVLSAPVDALAVLPTTMVAAASAAGPGLSP